VNMIVIGCGVSQVCLQLVDTIKTCSEQDKLLVRVPMSQPRTQHVCCVAH